MANFVPIVSWSFPSPSTACTPVASSLRAPISFSNTPLHSRSIPTSNGIQFPSPLYSSAANGSSQISNTVVRTNLHPLQHSKGDLHCLLDNSMSNVRKAWHHNIPSTMPWSNSPPFSSTLVQFTAASTTPRMSTSERISSVENLHVRRLKRRAQHSYSELDMGSDSKVFINEDRVAEGMRNLQLSNGANNNTTSTSNRNQAWFMTQTSHQHATGIPNTETGEMEDEPVSTSSPKLKFSNELKSVITKKDLVQQLIMEEMNKTCKQIVLWRPPGDQIKHIISSRGEVIRKNNAHLSRDMDVIDMGIPTNHVAHSTSSMNPRGTPGGDVFTSSNMESLQVASSHVHNTNSSQSSVAMDMSVIPPNRNSLSINETSQHSVSPGNGIVLPTMPQRRESSDSPSFYYRNNNNVLSHTGQIPFQAQRNFPAHTSQSLNTFMNSSDLQLRSEIENSTIDFMEDDDLDL